MRAKCIAALAVAALAVSACQDAGTKQTVGTLLGAAGGAVAGSQIGSGSGQIVATAAGTLLGAWLGSEIGKSLDRADKLAMQQTTQQALESAPSGTSSSWRNPDSGHGGTVTPKPAYTNASNEVCRDFEQTVTIEGETQTAYGTACRQADGSWKIISG